MRPKYTYQIFLPLLLLVGPSFAADLTIYQGDKEIKLSEHYKIRECGPIRLADCPDCLDAPSYYFHRASGQVISRCAGACWHPDKAQAKICASLCPPPQWHCDKQSNIKP